MILFDFVIVLVVLLSVLFGTAFAWRALQNLPQPKDAGGKSSLLVPMLLVGILALVLFVMALIVILVVVTSNPKY